MFLERYLRGEIDEMREAESAVFDSPTVTLSSPTLMPPPPVVPVTQLMNYSASAPSVMPVLLSQIGDTTDMATQLPPGVSLEALSLLRQHGVAQDSEWLWRASAYATQDLARMLGESAPSTASADLLRQYGVEGNSDWVWRATQYDIGSLGRLLADSFPGDAAVPFAGTRSEGFLSPTGGGGPSLPSLVSAPPTFAPLPQVGGSPPWAREGIVDERPSPGVSLPVLLGAAAALFLLF